MSNPYGPPAGSGQQGPGSYPGQAPAAWGPAQGAGPYGAPPSYGQPPNGPGAPAGPGYGPGPSYGGPNQGGPGSGGPGSGGPGSDGPGQWGGPPPPAGSSPKAPKPPKAPRPPRAPGTGPDLARILPLASLVLGVIAFIAGFLKAASLGDGSTSISLTVFGGGPSYLPILLLIVGLLAVAPLIPGGKKFSLVTVLLSVAGLLGAIGSLSTNTFVDVAAGAGSATSSKGFGLILLLILAILLIGTTGFGWATEAGILKPATPSAAKPPAGPAQTPYGSSAPAPAPTPAAPASQGSYGGYPPGGYQPPTDGYQSYGQPSSEPATSGQPAPAAPSTGSTPAVEPPSYGGSYGQGPTTGQHGRDDGPPPDVTQQVRF